MCGISGAIRKGDDVQNLLAAAERAQAHRGPDGTGSTTTRMGHWNVGLGHQRLAIIDLSTGGAQPMQGLEGDDLITFNGEVYNYIELRERLRAEGARFATETDTEVVATALRRWGIERALESFNGMWALAWLDRRSGRLVLARDRAGKKPLYYRSKANELTFASELKALLAMSEERYQLDLGVVRAFLKQSLLNTSPQSMFSGVESLPGGHYAVMKLDSPTLELHMHQYWRPPVEAALDVKAAPGSEEGLAAEVRELFLDAVRLRLRSDVPVGVLLSGGLDSSAIACAIHSDRAIGADVAMLSAVSGDVRFDESRFVDIVGRHLGRAVHKVDIDIGVDEAFDLLERVTWHNDEPVHSFATVAHYKLMEAAKDLGVKVVLSGQGADELLCGYKKYLAFSAQSLVRQGRHFEAARLMFDSWRQGTVLRQFDIREARRYLPFSARNGSASVLGPALDGLPDLAVGLQGLTLQGRQALDFSSLTIPALTHYEDRMSMAHGREIRLPFLDVRLVEKLLPLDGAQKIKHGWTKYIFRKAMEADLPREITWRKDKQGFNLPQSEWLRGPMRGRVLDMLGEDAGVFSHGLIDRQRFLARYEAFSNETEARGTVWYREIFNVISMEMWLRRFGDYLTTN